MPKTFKPTLLKPTKMGSKLTKTFKKEIIKQLGMQQVSKPNIKIKEDKDDFAMSQSGYNDLGVGKLKTNRKKDLDPSFKELTFESLKYIDESDNISLGPIKRDINENKKLITKKELIESTLNEEINDYVYFYASTSGESGENEGTKNNPFTVLKAKSTGFIPDAEDKARTIANENNLELIGGLFHGSSNVIDKDGYYQGSYYKVIEVPFETKPTEDIKNKFIVQMIEYESGNLSEEDTLKLFSHLIKSNMIKGLQGHYGRMANELMSMGYLSSKGDILKFSLNEEKKKGNPWAICGAKINKKENPDKFEKCVKEVKKQYNIKEELTEEKYLKENREISYEGSDLALYAENDYDTYAFVENNRNVRDIFEFALNRYEKEIGPLEYGDKETLFYEFANEYVYPEEYPKEEQLEETTTSSSSGQFQTPFAWAPNKKGWANAKKRWWGENSPNTGGSISKGGVVNIKDNCKGYSNSKIQCNSGDIGNITITEEAQKLIDKLSKEYNKDDKYIKNLIKEDHINKIRQTKDNWKGEGCKNYDDSKDICLDNYIKKENFDNKVTENEKTKEWEKQIQKGRYLDIKNIRIKPIDKDLLFEQLYNKTIVKDGEIWDLKFESGNFGLIDTPRGWIFTDDEFIHREPMKEKEFIEFDLYGTRKVGTISHATMMPITEQKFTIKQLLNNTLPETTIGKWSNRIDYNERIRGNQALLLQTIEKSFIPSNYELNEQLNNISDEQISQFVKKQLIKEGYLPEEDKQLNEFKGMKPVFKNKETGEFWELGEIYHNVITLNNLKDLTQTIKVDGKELKNNFIKLGSGIGENTGPDTSGLYGSYKDIEGDMSLISNDITENNIREQLKNELNNFKK